MKSILIHNFTRSNIHRLSAFLEKHKFYNVHAQIEPEFFTREILGLCKRFGLNVVIPVDGLEGSHNSVAEIVKRNPDFEALVAEYPREKIELLRHSKMDSSAENLIGLALNWPRIRIRALRAMSHADAYYHEAAQIDDFMRENPAEADEMNIVWGDFLENNFAMFDYGLVEQLGLIGDNVCLVTTK
ncbi:MAG: hypothetical protein ACRDBQ_19075 [Shewanella sp.]